MKKKSLVKLTTTAMLSAIALILGYFAFPIFPQVAFLEYDLCDIAVLIASFSFGPIYGMCSSFVVALFQAFLLDKSGVFGFVMNIISTFSFIIPASLLYKKKKTMKRALLSLIVGVLSMVMVMTVFNYLITPIFMHCTIEFVHSLMMFIVLFNFIKGILNSAITFFAYKHVRKIIKKFD